MPLHSGPGHAARSDERSGGWLHRLFTRGGGEQPVKPRARGRGDSSRATREPCFPRSREVRLRIRSGYDSAGTGQLDGTPRYRTRGGRTQGTARTGGMVGGYYSAHRRDPTRASGSARTATRLSAGHGTESPARPAPPTRPARGRRDRAAPCRQHRRSAQAAPRKRGIPHQRHVTAAHETTQLGAMRGAGARAARAGGTRGARSQPPPARCNAAGRGGRGAAPAARASGTGAEQTVPAARCRPGLRPGRRRMRVGRGAVGRRAGGVGRGLRRGGWGSA